MMARVGILALQGDFEEHAARLRALGCETVELRNADDLAVPLDGLVLPGGESTVQTALLEEFKMREPIRAMIAEDIPVFATCAGLVLLAQEVEHTNGSRDDRSNGRRSTEDGDHSTGDHGMSEHGTNAHGRDPREQDRTLSNDPEQSVRAGVFATLPVRVRRNAYGRQLASSHKIAPFRMDDTVTFEEAPLIPMTFIRAPQIIEVGQGAQVLAKDGEAVVAVRFGNQLGITFHPELDTDDTIYRLFLGLIEDRARRR